MSKTAFTPSSSRIRYLIIRGVERTTNVTAVTNTAGAVECPFTGTVVSVGAYNDVAGTTNTFTVDINKNGTTILSTKITVDSTETSSRTAATPAVISVPAIAAGDLLTFDHDAIHTTPAQGATYVVGIRAAV